MLYVIGHSGRGVDFLANTKGTVTLTADQLMDDWTSDKPDKLPSKIHSIRIWACFTGINGFAQQIRTKLLAKNMGYNPEVIGYNELLGHPHDNGPDDPQKHVWGPGPDAKTRGPMLGRASAQRTIFNS